MSRILQITTLSITSQVFILPLADRLARQGHQVELAYGGPGYQPFAPYPTWHVALTRNPLHPLNGRGLLQLVTLMRRQRYDIVHTHTPVAGLVGRLAARLASVPLVLYTLHGSFWETRPRWRSILFDRLERLAANWTSHVFAFNQADATDLRQRCHFNPTQISRVPVGGAGVDLSRFDPNLYPPEQVKQQRSRLGIHPDDWVIGYVGRLDRDKGLTELLVAAAQLRRTFPRLRLLLVGDRLTGDRATVIESQLAALGQTVITTGFRSDVPAMLACMDVVVSASHRDGFGMVLAEAAAMGKPVVATLTRGAPAAVIDQQTGLLVPIGQAERLAAAIAHLLTNPDLRRQMGAAARRLATERFEQQQTMDFYAAEYARLLQAKGLPLPAAPQPTTIPA
ncbi:MAG: putative glycosyltransferase EpsD [Anaerolineae bacterium]|nr:putative glycosyltransferase EpsD [Anaerolineae bacterium]